MELHCRFLIRLHGIRDNLYTVVQEYLSKVPSPHQISLSSGQHSFFVFYGLSRVDISARRPVILGGWAWFSSAPPGKYRFLPHYHIDAV
jgi:hypothetical protein